MSHSPLSSRIVNLKQGAALLRGGGILVYPTETFYAIGCLANNPATAAAIAEVKERSASRPMPLIATSQEQASLAVRLEYAPQDLLEKFWPGPLTILLPALPQVADKLRNADNQAAIRVSAGALARNLASAAGWPLASSSANISGHAPCQEHRLLDPCLLARLERSGFDYGILAGENPSTACLNAPSSIVETVAGQSSHDLRILREGAISRKELEMAGFRIIS